MEFEAFNNWEEIEQIMRAKVQEIDKILSINLWAKQMVQHELLSIALEVQKISIEWALLIPPEISRKNTKAAWLRI
jgi:hypothetical protein